MPITFNSQGGFLNGTISSSNGDIFITTSGSAGNITIGNLKLTGSVVQEADSDGVVRLKKTFNSDGSILEERFNATGIKTSQTTKTITGIETIQSASATSNQIQFQQFNGNSSIFLSGSDPKFSIVRSGGANGWQSSRRAQRNFFLSASIKFAHGLSSQGDYYFSPADSAAGINDAVLFENNPPFFMISQSGDVVIKGGKLIAEEYVVSSSVTEVTTLAQSGSTKFGDTVSDDTHQFTGSILITGSLTTDSIDINGGTLDNITSLTFANNIDVGNVTLRAQNILADARTSGRVAFYTTNGALSDDSDLTFSGDTLSATQISSTNITASGNISSSGTIKGAGYELNNETAISNDATTLIFGFDNSWTGIDIGRASVLTQNIRLTGPTHALSHITASGDISASGIVYMDSASIGGGIFTSASLAAGGGGGGSMDSFTLTADGGSNQTIEDGNTLDIAGGTNITTAVGATDTVTVNLDASPSITNLTASGNISASGTIESTGNISTNGSITATSADINGAVDIDGGNLTVGTGLQFTNAGVFNFGSSLDNGRITWGTEFASLYGKSATTKLRLGSMDTQGVLTISSSHENTMVISGSNVGIGTTSPGEKLEVVGNISASGVITGEGLVISDDAEIADDLTVKGTLHITSSTDPNLILEDPNGSSVLRFRRTDQNKNIDLSMEGNDLRIISTDNDGSQNVLIGVNASSVKRDNRLGIGQPTPSEALDVSGSMNISGPGNITASGDISASGNIIADGIKATLPAGVDNSVVILDADGFLKTDEVDSFIFATSPVRPTGADTFGSSHDGKFPFIDDGDTNTLDGGSNLKNVAGGIEVTGNITASNNISASGTIFANDFQSATGGSGIDFNDDVDISGSLDVGGDLTTRGFVNQSSSVYIPQSEFFDVANSKFVCLISGSNGQVDADVVYGTFEDNTTISILGTGSSVDVTRPLKETIFIENKYSSGSIAAASLNFGDIIEADKPITIVESNTTGAKGKEGNPLNFASKTFLTYGDRNHPVQVMMYSPFAAGSVTMSVENVGSDNPGGGTFVPFISASIEADGTLDLRSSGSDDSGNIATLIQSTVPIVAQSVATRDNDNDDATVLMPLDSVILNVDSDSDRKLRLDSTTTVKTFTATTSSHAPTADANADGNTPASKSSMKVFTSSNAALTQYMLTGDGNGSDAVMGIGTNTIGDTYIIPHAVGGLGILSTEPAIISCSQMNNDGTLSFLFAVDHRSASVSTPLGFQTGSTMNGYSATATGSDHISASLSPKGLYIEGTGNFGLRTNTIGHDEYTPLGYRRNENTNFNKSVKYYFKSDTVVNEKAIFNTITASGVIKAATLDAAAVSDTLAAAIVSEIDNDEIPIAKLAEDAVTITAGDGLKTGGSVTLGDSVTLDIDVSDFAGTGLSADGSENLNVDAAQTQITSVGALSSLTVAGDMSVTSSLFKGDITASGNISSSLTGSFEKVTIGTATPANSHVQLTAKGGNGGNAIAHFERTLGGTGTIKISANASEPQINFKADNDNERMNIGVERAGGAFVIASGSSIADKEIVVVTQDNKVGINTTSPTKALQVAGDISSSGTITGLSGSFSNLDVLDNDAGANPRFRVGRNTGENIAFSVIDLDTTITADQDNDSNGAHNFILNRTFDGIGESKFSIQKGGTDQFVIGVSGSITASGNISASGIITANTMTAEQITSTDDMNVTDDLIVGGNISASGTVFTNEIDAPSGDITIDSAGDIILDADGTDIILKDDGTSFGSFKRASSDFIIKAETADKDILFKGTDGSSTITALTLDMSEAGAATFNSDITAGGDVSASGFIKTKGVNITDSGNASFISQSGTSAGFSNQIFIGDVSDVGGSGFLKIFNNDGDEVEKAHFSGMDVGIKAVPAPNMELTVAGDISASGIVYMDSASIGGGIFTSASLAAGGGGGAVSAVANGANNRVATFSSADELNGESGLTFDGNDLTVNRDITMGRSLVHDGDTNTQILFDTDTINFSAGGSSQLTLQSGHITASGNISCSGEYLGNQIQIYNANFQDDISTSVHYVPIGTNNFEQTTEDADEVGFVAPYDGELVKIIYRHNFDASSTTTRWSYTVITDGTDLAGSPTARFRATVTGATTDTIKEITVADADSTFTDDMFFNKGETIFLSINNGVDVTTTAAEFHVTVVLKFNIPLGLI